MSKKYYVPGHGYYDEEPLVTKDSRGNAVVQAGGVLRNGDGALHAAYDLTPDSPMAPVFQKWDRGDALTEADKQNLASYLRKKGFRIGNENDLEAALMTRSSQWRQGLPGVPTGAGGANLKNPYKMTAKGAVFS